MTKQFNRHIEVRIIGKNDTLVINEELDIEFTCRKDRSTTPNEASVRIKNLSETSKRFISADAYVEVYTGYNTDRTLVMRMDVSRRSTVLQPPDSITTIETFDGLTALKDKEIKITLAPKTSLKRGIEIVAQQAGLKFRVEDLSLNVPLLSGYTHSGKLTGALDDLTSVVKASWGIVNNEIVIVKRGKGIGTPRFVISPENGLLESPKILESTFVVERPIKKSLKVIKKTKRIKSIKTSSISNANLPLEERIKAFLSSSTITEKQKNVKSTTKTTKVVKTTIREITPTKSENPIGYDIVMLMRPNLNPFDKIEIQSRFVNGVFVVDQVEHLGSTRGGEYITRATVYESK